MSSLQRRFSHIYVERAASEHPDCRSVLERFGGSVTIPIDTYKEVFNRSGQDFAAQKASQKLILAVRTENFLYEGSRMSPDCGFESFYYNTLAMNCLYDCHYCYLQGMYPSANIVLFVNNEDYVAETKRKLSGLKSMYLCISYDTDLLALEGILPYCRRWIGFAREEPALFLEIRTKSAGYASIADVEPIPNVTIAWSMSPASVASRFEPGTASLAGRLKAARKAVDDGWRIRICIDPILLVDGWREEYRGLVREIFETIPAGSIGDVSIGSFRTNAGFLKRMRRIRPDSPALHRGLERHGGVWAYPDSLEEDLTSYVADEIRRYLPGEKLIEPFRTTGLA